MRAFGVIVAEGRGPMLILPRKDAPDGKADAQRLLLEVVNQRVKVSLIVLGDDDHRRKIASRADVRADGHPFRRVVWIPDIEVLADQPRFAVLVDAIGKGDEAVAMTLEFKLSSRLRGAEAESFIKLEQAFARALAGHEAP